MATPQSEPGRGWATRVSTVLMPPEASRGERAVGWAAALIGAALGAGVAATHGGSALLIVALTVIGFDLFGGVVVNVLPSASTRFHAGGPRGRLLFVAGHAHLPVLALITPELSWPAAGALYAIQLGSAVLIEAVPAKLRRPVAFACAATVITVAVSVVPVPAALAWVAPVLSVKLLIGHLLRHDRVRAHAGCASGRPGFRRGH
ncbi:hypothetical protein [Mycolicibacterium brumae]|uniref:Uncharacterized protein n=1 Tax=Mycolicibacterium brumae TaxID=85968 RepID=A0A2G5P8E2_9MYCO|nr:hypothetical protein [Mycolicibacterium brumae]MCV7193905.1 hypothetical protein [Mycolicibacterium brumae]PIB74651.1 hypothetical protein CQY22_012215 [Mycolicibacterium brumae]RWA21822.1 hypothetical protein MBRU_14050 [Mycolicibacterium brumae DSM 44177]UWW08110.1 hypothetical protein L2Z93_001153 [Mycolicibacterium brumae]